MTYRTIALALAAAGLTLSTAALAGDDEFKGDSATTWSARSLMMANVLGGGTDFQSIRHTLAVSCDGITGEQIHHEYGKVPKWALSSQVYICYAYAGWAGKFGGSKAPCSLLEKGLKELDNAQPGKAPDEVVSAAGELRTTVSNLLQGAQGTHACKL